MSRPVLALVAALAGSMLVNIVLAASLALAPKPATPEDVSNLEVRIEVLLGAIERRLEEIDVRVSAVCRELIPGSRLSVDACD